MLPFIILHHQTNHKKLKMLDLFFELVDMILQVTSLYGGPLEFIFVVESTEDPAYHAVSQLLKDYRVCCFFTFLVDFGIKYVTLVSSLFMSLIWHGWKVFLLCSLLTMYLSCFLMRIRRLSSEFLFGLFLKSLYEFKCNNRFSGFCCFHNTMI